MKINFNFIKLIIKKLILRFFPDWFVIKIQNWLEKKRIAKIYRPNFKNNAENQSFFKIIKEINSLYGGKEIMHCTSWAIGAHIIFNGLRVDACCMPTHGCQPFLFDFNGGVFPLEKYYQGVFNLIKKNQEGTGECVGCRFLKKMKVNKKFIPYATSFIGQGHANLCTARCIYCVQTQSQNQIFDSMFNMADTIRNIISQGFYRPNLTSFSWGGGEPTILKDFEETCALLSQNGFLQNVNTNAIKYSPALGNTLKSGNTISVQVSVDSGTRECYKKVKGVDQFDAVWKNIYSYAQRGPIQLKYIVLSLNSSSSEVDAFLEKCREGEIKRLIVSADINSTQKPLFEVPYTAVINEQELTAAARLIKKGRAQGIDVSLDQFTWGDIYATQIHKLIKQI